MLCKKYPEIVKLADDIYYATTETLKADTDDRSGEGFGTQVGLILHISKSTIEDHKENPYFVIASIVPHRTRNMMTENGETIKTPHLEAVLKCYSEIGGIRIEDAITSHSRLPRESGIPMTKIARQFEARGGVLASVPNSSLAHLSARYGRGNTTDAMFFKTSKQAMQYARALLDRFVFSTMTVDRYIELQHDGRNNGWNRFSQMQNFVVRGRG